MKFAIWILVGFLFSAVALNLDDMNLSVEAMLGWCIALSIGFFFWMNLNPEKVTYYKRRSHLRQKFDRFTAYEDREKRGQVRK